MRPIVLVHGFGGGLYEFKAIHKFLLQRGFDKFYFFTYDKKFGQVSLKKIADQLASFIEKNVKETEIDIIGFSQGGVIARLFIDRCKNKRIINCITLCSPHNGSALAYLSNMEGFIDLRPKSDLLNELNSKKCKAHLYCVYTPFDLMVIPGWSAKVLDGKIKKVYSLLHPLAFSCKGTLEFIDVVLRK